MKLSERLKLLWRVLTKKDPRLVPRMSIYLSKKDRDTIVASIPKTDENKRLIERLKNVNLADYASEMYYFI